MTTISRTKPAMLAAIAALLLLVCSGCEPVPAAGSGLVGKEAPWFRLARIDGPETTLDDVRGTKATLIDFWATWCSPCIAEIPHLEDVSKKYRDRGLSVVGVLLDENAEELGPDFVRGMDITYPNLIGTVEVESAYEVRSFPTLVMLDETGTVIDVRTRALGHDELVSWVESALGGGGPEAGA